MISDDDLSALRCLISGQVNYFEPSSRLVTFQVAKSFGITIIPLTR